MNQYNEPELSIIVLDFLKEEETRLCLESIKRRVKFDTKVIYYHNGDGADYPSKFFKEGLCDVAIQTRKNEGLGIGTRDTFNFVFSPYVLSLQNDQIIGRDFGYAEFSILKSALDSNNRVNGSGICMSISLAGPVCGENIYSERCHIIKSSFYKWMEINVPLGYAGAGPFHGEGDWREAQIQKFYKSMGYIHFTSYPPLVIDNGKRAVRQNPDGSIWEHRPDTKGLKLISGPVKEKYTYPYFTDLEWEEVISSQKWEDWKIPEKEIEHSFKVWN